MASNRVGLPSGSLPPVRAATSMFLINFAKSLPRLASLAAFWCLVVAHLEWPLMSAEPLYVVLCADHRAGLRCRPTAAVDNAAVRQAILRRGRARLDVS